MDTDPLSSVAPQQLQEPLDWVVLGHLEDLEQERINFGLYETFLSAAEILQNAAGRGTAGRPCGERTSTRRCGGWSPTPGSSASPQVATARGSARSSAC